MNVDLSIKKMLFLFKLCLFKLIFRFLADALYNKISLIKPVRHMEAAMLQAIKCRMFFTTLRCFLSLQNFLQWRFRRAHATRHSFKPLQQVFVGYAPSKYGSMDAFSWITGMEISMNPLAFFRLWH